MADNLPPVADSLGALSEAALDAERALRGFDSDAGDGNRRGALQRRDAREGRSLGFWTSLVAYKQLHHLAVDEDSTVENILNEAMNLLFRDRGLDPIAPVRRRELGGE